MILQLQGTKNVKKGQKVVFKIWSFVGNPVLRVVNCFLKNDQKNYRFSFRFFSFLKTIVSFTITLRQRPKGVPRRQR